MNFRTTLIIIVLLAGIGGAYYLFFQESADETPNEKQRIHQVYGIARENVQQVEISFADAAYQKSEIGKRYNG